MQRRPGRLGILSLSRVVRCAFVLIALAALPARAAAVTWDLVRPSNTGIPGEEMRFIRFTPDGTMYVASRWYFWQEGGIGIYDRAADTWSTWSDHDTVLPSEYVNDLVFAPNGDVWISTDAGLVLKRGDQWTVFTTANAPFHNNEIKELALAPDGHLWLNNSAVAGGLAGIFEYTGTEWREYRVGRELPWATPWYGLSDVIVDHLGHVWVSNTVLNGIAEYDGTRWKLYGGSQDRFDDLLEDASGNIWMISGVGGYNAFWKYNRTAFTRYDCTNTPINCTTITVNALDDDGSIYVADWFGRVIRTTNGGASWSIFGTVDNFVTAIGPDPISGDVWVATRDNLFKKDASGATVRSLNHYNTGMPDWWIDNFFSDTLGNLWMASAEVGASRFDGARWRNWGAHNLGSEPWPFLAESAYGLYQDSQGDIWIGSNGVGRMTPALSSIELWDWRTTPIFGVDRFDYFTEDRNGALFTAAQYGNVFRFDRAARTWSREPISVYAPMGIPGMTADRDGNVWVAEWFELDRWDGSAWSTVGADWGLFDLGGVNCIAFGPDGTMWLGTAEGLLRVRGTERTLYTPTNSPLPAWFVVSIDFRPDGLMALSASDFGSVTPFPNGVAVINGSIDDPASWSVYRYGDSPLPHYQLGKVHFDTPGDLWISAVSEAVAVIRFGEATSVAAAGGPRQVVAGGAASVSAAPNPFHPRTTIRFELGERASDVRLNVFDVAGRRVRSLAAGTRDAGVHEVAWDGRDDAGRELPSGVYFGRLEAGSVVKTARLILAR